MELLGSPSVRVNWKVILQPFLSRFYASNRVRQNAPLGATRQSPPSRSPVLGVDQERTWPPSATGRFQWRTIKIRPSTLRWRYRGGPVRPTRWPDGRRRHYV